MTSFSENKFDVGSIVKIILSQDLFCGKLGLIVVLLLTKDRNTAVARVLVSGQVVAYHTKFLTLADIQCSA